MPRYTSKTKNGQLIVRAKILSNEHVNEIELNFIEKMNIDGLLNGRYIRRFPFKWIEYTGIIGIDLFERLKKPITKYDFFFMVEQVVDIFEKIETNGLLVNKIDWNIHNVYINENTREMQFIYLPFDNFIQKENTLDFLKNMIYSVNLSVEHSTNYISEFAYFIKKLKDFDPKKIEDYVKRQNNSIVETIKNGEKCRKEYDINSTKEQEVYQLENDNEDETRPLDEELTYPLNIQHVKYAKLLRVSTNEVISINKEVFNIGQDCNFADYVVKDNNTISKKHISIITRGLEYYVMDLKSKNKTYINERIIPVGQEVRIKDQDCLRLSNEEFVFFE